MTIHACVIGTPIKHSRSPLIHGHWIKEHGLDATYTKLEVLEPDLEAFLERIRSGELAGCNVTVPHKEAVLALVDQADEAARAIGAANTVWCDGDVLHASNTDAYGFLANLDAATPGWDRRLETALVLGAGGAARAILYALLSRGISKVHLVNRTKSRADALASHFGSSVSVSDWDDRHALCGTVGFIVNTTSLGMTGSNELDLDLAAAAGTNTLVTDLVYVPLETRLLRDAKALGLRTVDGLGMLLHQAVPGFEKWFGVRPDVSAELRHIIVQDLEAT